MPLVLGYGISINQWELEKEFDPLVVPIEYACDCKSCNAGYPTHKVDEAGMVDLGDKYEVTIHWTGSLPDRVRFYVMCRSSYTIDLADFDDLTIDKSTLKTDPGYSALCDFAENFFPDTPIEFYLINI